MMAHLHHALGAFHGQPGIAKLHGHDHGQAGRNRIQIEAMGVLLLSHSLQNGDSFCRQLQCSLGLMERVLLHGSCGPGASLASIASKGCLVQSGEDVRGEDALPRRSSGRWRRSHFGLSLLP